MKPQDKPVWYDVYEAFPPKYEPRYDRPPVKKEIQAIFYPEDVIRGYVKETAFNFLPYHALVLTRYIWAGKSFWFYDI